jgi:hypothetical protein
MNERIKELERQCWNSQTNHLDAEKFAQLIVEKCIGKIDSAKNITRDDMVSLGYKDWNSYKGALHLAKNKIRKHFGVE